MKEVENMNNQFPNQPVNPQMNQQAGPQTAQQANPQMNPQVGQWANPQVNRPYVPPVTPVTPPITPPSDPAKKKQLNMISVIIGVVCTLMIIFATNNVINGSIFNIPIMQLIVGDEMDEMKDEFDEYLDDLEDLSDDEIDEFEDESGMSIKEAEKFLKAPSISATAKFIKIDEVGMDDESIALLSGIQIFVILYGGIIALLMFLGAVLKNRALSIVSTVISFLFHLALSGILFFILQVAFCVAHVVVLTKAKKA